MAIGGALLGFGTIIQAVGNYENYQNQAANDHANASFYREQAKFAAEAGREKLQAFDNESLVLAGNQGSAFAKAGVDMSSQANFIGNQALMRQREAYSIKSESDMNVRLANMRADNADRAAGDAGSAGIWSVVGGLAGGAAKLF